MVCIALGVDDCLEGVPARPYISVGYRVTWKVLAKYSWSPTTTQSGSFLCTAASSTPIRVVTREVRYIHKLSLTLEHSMPISSPAAPGLTRQELLASQELHGRPVLLRKPDHHMLQPRQMTQHSLTHTPLT